MSLHNVKAKLIVQKLAGGVPCYQLENNSQGRNHANFLHN